jgi:hypothetical protein
MYELDSFAEKVTEAILTPLKDVGTLLASELDSLTARVGVLENVVAELSAALAELLRQS